MTNKSNRFYQHIRRVLDNLTNALSDTPRSDSVCADLERSRIYLHDHCSECGRAITSAEYAQIYAQECVRVGAAGVASIEECPICLVCYARLRRALAAFAPSVLERLRGAMVMPSLGVHAERMHSVGLSPYLAVRGQPNGLASLRATSGAEHESECR